MEKTITSNKKDALSVFPKNPDCPEYIRLIKAQNPIYLGTHLPIKIQDTYFDYGQNWMYTTLIACPENKMSWQILTPKEQEYILYGTEEQFKHTVQTVIARLNKQYNTQTRYSQLIKTDNLRLKFEEQLSKTERSLTRDILTTLWREINTDTTLNPTTKEIQEILKQQNP